MDGISLTVWFRKAIQDGQFGFIHQTNFLFPTEKWHCEMFQAKEVWGAPSSWPSRSWRGTTSASSAPSARSPWWARASYREGGGYTEQGNLRNLLRYFCTYWLPLYRSWSSCYSLFLALAIFRQASPVLMLKHLIFRVLGCWCWSTWEIYFTLFLR